MCQQAPSNGTTRFKRAAASSKNWARLGVRSASRSNSSSGCPLVLADTNDDLAALLGCAEAFIGLGIIVPSRSTQLLRWCLQRGLRIVQQSTLMSIGLYNEPAGAYLPSILF